MVVRGPDTDVIGRVRDVVVTIRSGGQDSRVLGLVVELINNKRRIFLPMLRIAAIEPKDINLISGSVSLRSFKARTGELQVLGDIIGTKVHTDDPELEQLHGRAVEIADVELEQTRTRDWVISRVALIGERPKFGRRPALYIAPWSHVHGITAGGTGETNQTAELIAGFEDMRAADVAKQLYGLPSPSATWSPGSLTTNDSPTFSRSSAKTVRPS